MLRPKNLRSPIKLYYRRRIKDTESLRNALSSPDLPLSPTFEPIMLKSESPTVHMHQIPHSRLKIMTEESDVPNYVTLMFHFAVGSRFETAETQGYTKWLHSSIFNSLTQYPVLLMNSSIDQTRDSLVLKSVCPSYHVEEFVHTLAQILGPNALDSRVLEMIEPVSKSDFDVSELLVERSYADSGLANPLNGDSLNWTTERIFEFEQSCQDFHRRFLNTDNFLVSASGVFNSQAFCDLISEKFAYLHPAENEDDKVSTLLKSEKPEFKPASVFSDLRIPLKEETLMEEFKNYQVGLMVGWEGYPRNHPSRAIAALVQEIIGSAYQFAAGGPGRNNMCRTHNMMARFPYFEQLEFNKISFFDW